MHPLTRPVDLLAHFLWTLGLSSPPEGPPASCPLAAPAPEEACRCTSRKESCHFCCPGGWWVCLGPHLGRGALDKHSCSAWCQGEPAPSASRATANKSAFYCFLYNLIMCYIPSSMKYGICKKSCWIENKYTEHSDSGLGEARDAALLTHSRWCNVAGPQLSLWVARLSRGTCIFKNWSIVDLQMPNSSVW